VVVRHLDNLKAALGFDLLRLFSAKVKTNASHHATQQTTYTPP
jgi:hypothetical protein